jgi:glycosyltransferase involved in cell wall biosynthesis
MASVAWRYLNMSKPNGYKHSHSTIAPQFLEEDFYNKLKLQVDPKEYSLYNSFNLSIAINPREKEIIAANTSDTLVEYVPFAFQTADISNTYNEQAIFAVGPNQFNIQGYMYFVSKVLPIVLEKSPDFCLQVVGDGCRFLTEVEGTKLHGFVPDLQAVYASSKFAICPLIGATGQQLKVLEAMAHGLPVVALRNVAERCPIEHGVNGFVANDAEEFAVYTIQLFQDAQLCRKLGDAARQRIQNEFSRKSMVLQLDKSIHALQVKGLKIKQKKATSIMAALKYNTLATQEELLYMGKLGWKKIDFLKRKLALRVRIKKIMGRA